TRAAGLREPIFDRGPPQPDDRFHRLDVFRTDLDTEVAPRTVPDPMVVLERRESGSCRLMSISRVGEETIGLRQGGRADKPLRNFMHGTRRDAGAAHNAGIHIVKLRITVVLSLRPRRDTRTPRPNRRHQPGMHVADLLPE